MRNTLFNAGLTLAFCLGACSNDMQNMPPPKQRTAENSQKLLASQKSEDTTQSPSSASAIGTTDATPDSPAATPAASPDSPPVDSTDNSTTVNSPSAPIVDGKGELIAILEDCGFPGGVLPDPSVTVFQASLKSQQVTTKGSKPISPAMIGLPVIPFAPPLPPANYTAIVRASVEVNASMATTKQSVRIGLEGFSVSVLGISVPPDLGKADALAQVQANNSDTSATGPSNDERANLIGHDGPWKGIYCTLNGSKSLSYTKNGKSKTISFDPPIPGGIWAKASPARFKAEVGSGRTFSNVKATVTSSNDSSMPAGTVVQGTVTVSPISGSLPELGVNADIAYIIRSDFGANTVNLGLSPSQAFYVSSSTKDMSAIVIETGVTEMPRLVLSK
ncbi:MAG: hypothetical protein NTZ90_00955 [Proteobacteria bacterium]|nr:hypothetical protein [Pseudomonadota bacterium]